MAKRPCRRCGMEIEFIGNEATGNMIPAQKIRTVYRGVIQPDGSWMLKKEELEEAQAFYVSHFETCPHASDFSSRGS